MRSSSSRALMQPKCRYGHSSDVSPVQAVAACRRRSCDHHASMRLRPALSPAGTTALDLAACAARDLADTQVRGIGILRGAPWISRRGSSLHARQNGVNTAYGLGLPMSATKLPGVRRGSTPASRERGHDALVAGHRERRDVGREVDGARRRARLASFGSSRSGFPRSTTRFAAALLQRRAQLAQALEQERVCGSS